MKWLLATTFILSPVAAYADPVTLFFSGLGMSATTAAIATNLVVGFGAGLVERLLFRPQSGRTKVENAQVNTRLENAIRWQAGGTVAIGGSVGTFAEKDASGNLWYIVTHADAELNGNPTYILDGIPVTLSDGLDGFTAGDVITDDFCLDSKGAQYSGSGTKVPVFRIYTRTPDATHVYGNLPAVFTSAFSAIPADFYLAGLTYTVVRCKALDSTKYRNAYRWRGALGLGEPSVVMVGNFGRMYDPRNGAHDINDSTTWTASNGNPAILWAWWRTSRYGRNRPMSQINWDKVAEQADFCDETVLDRSGASIPRYTCGAAFPDDMLRFEAEKLILASCDGIVCYDDAGRAYPKVGCYEAPTLAFTAARDITTAATQIIDDGETAVDGVIVNYTEPSLGYTTQPCAPWQNDDWYDGSSPPNYQVVDIPTCYNHNQAVRLAKAIGRRIGATKRAALGVTVKGLLAKSERIISLDYDATFAGDFQIVGPVEEAGDGINFAFSVVPVASDNWTLNPGEEGVPPQATPALGVTVPDVVNPAPADLEAASALGAAGGYTASFTTANDSYQFAVAVYRGTTTTFSAATLIATVYAGPNTSGYTTESGVSAGAYYIWIEPQNAAGIAGTASGPYSITVT